MGRETVYLCYDFRRFSKAGDDRNVNESRKYLSTDYLVLIHCVGGGGGGGGGGGALEPKGGGGGGRGLGEEYSDWLGEEASGWLL